MTTRTLSLAVAVLAVAGLSAADKKIQRKDLPPAVEKAVQLEETKGATVKGLSTEVEGGKKMYEVEATLNGHSRDLLFDTTGRLVEAEEATTLDRGTRRRQSRARSQRQSVDGRDGHEGQDGHLRSHGREER
jgi:hypothetical protein